MVFFFFFPDTAVGVKFRGGESSNMRPRPLVLRKEGDGNQDFRSEGGGLRLRLLVWGRRIEVCTLGSDGMGLVPERCWVLGFSGAHNRQTPSEGLEEKARVWTLWVGGIWW